MKANRFGFDLVHKEKHLLILFSLRLSTWSLSIFVCRSEHNRIIDLKYALWIQNKLFLTARQRNVASVTPSQSIRPNYTKLNFSYCHKKRSSFSRNVLLNFPPASHMRFSTHVVIVIPWRVVFIGENVLHSPCLIQMPIHWRGVPIAFAHERGSRPGEVLPKRTVQKVTVYHSFGNFRWSHECSLWSSGEHFLCR